MKARYIINGDFERTRELKSAVPGIHRFKKTNGIKIINTVKRSLEKQYGNGSVIMKSKFKWTIIQVL